MSDPFLTMQRQIQAQQEQLERLRKADVASLTLNWTQRVLNPFPLASSGGVWGDTPQPWAVNLVAWYCSVFVSTTNNGTNFWTLTLVNTAGTTLASLSTSAISANTWTRLSTTSFTQPATTNVDLAIIATATLSPGSIIIAPTLSILRTGN